jgi:hypothetical protein
MLTTKRTGEHILRQRFPSSRLYRKEVTMTILALALLLAPAFAEARAGGQDRPLEIQGASSAVRKATVSGPRFAAPEVFHGHEDFHHPRLKRLRDEYRLEEAVKGEENDFRRVLRLRAWVHSRWPIDNSQNFSGDAFQILEKARDGSGFHCAHSMTVQYAVMTAMGYVARNLGTDADHEKFGKSRHHGVNEVWSNDHAKWVLLDAKYDSHFERAGVPLSALEVHDAVRAGKAGEVVTVRGLDRKPASLGGPDSVEASVENYWWVSWHVRADSFTQPHWSGGSRLVVPDNDAFRSTVWHRGGGANGLVRHWAYAANAFIPVRDARQIEWTPGVPSIRASQKGEGTLELRLASATPNFKEYETRLQGGEWKPSTERLSWTLEKGANVLEVRTRNLFGVAGPVLRASVVHEP